MDSDAMQDLQAVSAHVMSGVERIRSLEAEKRTLDPGSAKFRELSDEIERLAAEINQVSRAESNLADSVAGKPDLPTVAEADRAGPADRTA